MANYRPDLLKRIESYLYAVAYGAFDPYPRMSVSKTEICQALDERHSDVQDCINRLIFTKVLSPERPYQNYDKKWRARSHTLRHTILIIPSYASGDPWMTELRARQTPKLKIRTCWVCGAPVERRHKKSQIGHDRVTCDEHMVKRIMNG